MSIAARDLKFVITDAIRSRWSPEQRELSHMTYAI
jgi:hypothetical protein